MYVINIWFCSFIYWSGLNEVSRWLRFYSMPSTDLLNYRMICCSSGSCPCIPGFMYEFKEDYLTGGSPVQPMIFSFMASTPLPLPLRSRLRRFLSPFVGLNPLDSGGICTKYCLCQKWEFPGPPMSPLFGVELCPFILFIMSDSISPGLNICCCPSIKPIELSSLPIIWLFCPI